MRLIITFLVSLFLVGTATAAFAGEKDRLPNTTLTGNVPDFGPVTVVVGDNPSVAFRDGKVLEKTSVQKFPNLQRITLENGFTVDVWRESTGVWKVKVDLCNELPFMVGELSPLAS